MTQESRKAMACFPLKPFHPLTEWPSPPPVRPIKTSNITGASGGIPSPPEENTEPAARGDADSIAPIRTQANWSIPLRDLLHDCRVYRFSNASSRIKRLGMSARTFESAKREGLERRLFLESSAGQTVYLILTREAYRALDAEWPYERSVSVEHGFYVGLTAHVLKQDPSCRNAVEEMPVGTASATADVGTIALDGTRRAYEVTLSTGNCLSNAAKYANTDFVSITFVCRDYKLQEAVRACCREGGLEPNLLAKIEYTHFSALLRRQRTLYRY